MLQHRSDTEDLVHALFVDLLQRGKLDVDLPYLYRAMTHRCINHIRSQKNRQRLLAEHDVALRGPVRTPFDERILHIDLLLKLAEHLDDKHYEVLVYRYIDDMQLDEIASLLKKSRRTISKRLDKAKKTLRKVAAIAPHQANRPPRDPSSGGQP